MINYSSVIERYVNKTRRLASSFTKDRLFYEYEYKTNGKSYLLHYKVYMVGVLEDNSNFKIAEHSVHKKKLPF